MQTSNSTGQEIRYTVEGGRGPGGPIRSTLKLIGATLDNSYELGPYSYAASVNGTTAVAGIVNFFVEKNGEWVHAASGEFKDPSALVTLVGQPGQYRVEVAYPQIN